MDRFWQIMGATVELSLGELLFAVAMWCLLTVAVLALAAWTASGAEEVGKLRERVARLEGRADRQSDAR